MTNSSNSFFYLNSLFNSSHAYIATNNTSIMEMRWSNESGFSVFYHSLSAQLVSGSKGVQWWTFWNSSHGALLDNANGLYFTSDGPSNFKYLPAAQQVIQAKFGRQFFCFSGSPPGLCISAVPSFASNLAGWLIVGQSAIGLEDKIYFFSFSPSLESTAVTFYGDNNEFDSFIIRQAQFLTMKHWIFTLSSSNYYIVSTSDGGLSYQSGSITNPGSMSCQLYKAASEPVCLVLVGSGSQNWLEVYDGIQLNSSISFDPNEPYEFWLAQVQLVSESSYIVVGNSMFSSLNPLTKGALWNFHPYGNVNQIEDLISMKFLSPKQGSILALLSDSEISYINWFAINL
jgi:hypothetical protein